MSERHEGTTATGCAAFVLIAPLQVYYGLLLSHLWNWFAAPLFRAPVLGIAQAVGVAVLVAWFKGYDASKTGYKGSETGEQIAELLAVPVVYSLVFLIGYIAHLNA